MKEYNIARYDGTLLLGMWVPSKAIAQHYLKHYKHRYRPGKRYPNGKGFYPDFGFHIVEREYETDSNIRRGK